MYVTELKSQRFLSWFCSTSPGEVTIRIVTHAARFLGTLIAAICLWCLLSAPSSAQVTSDWVIVGNPRNAHDAATTHGRFGRVDYKYRINKLEVTNAQYCEFLNAVAVADPNDLYDANMRESDGGIDQQELANGEYRYVLLDKMGDKPVNFVDFFDAMRFVNWLENGRPTGVQGNATTEDGTYKIGTGTSEKRSPNSTYFLPDENEWYKAAYHKNDGVTGNYFDFPSSNDVAPNQAHADSNGDIIERWDPNVANRSPPAAWNGCRVTTVGSAQKSVSPYGTFDQGGNVAEWNEALVPNQPGYRRLRGGSWGTPVGYLSAENPRQRAAEYEGSAIGFRVASRAELDHFEVYSVTADPRIEGIVELFGKFNQALTKAKVQGPVAFANPVPVNPRLIEGGQILDEEAHLSWYTLKQQGQEPGRTVWVLNQLNDGEWQELDLGQPRGLLVPTEKQLAGQKYQSSERLDHFKMYEVLSGSKMSYEVELEDQFSGIRKTVARKPVYFCVPSETLYENKERVTIRNEFDYLTVYEIDPENQKHELTVSDRLGNTRLLVTQSRWLCVPTRLKRESP